jgi:hypothetical protein
MRWRKISESEVLMVLEFPERLEESVHQRKNAYKRVDSRWLKVTYKEEASGITVITALEKDS